jgi:hypothetical protein
MMKINIECIFYELLVSEKGINDDMKVPRLLFKFFELTIIVN